MHFRSHWISPDRPLGSKSWSCGQWCAIRAVDDGVIVPGVFGMVLAMVLTEAIGTRRA
jgi:hypothetical protein